MRWLNHLAVEVLVDLADLAAVDLVPNAVALHWSKLSMQIMTARSPQKKLRTQLLLY
jgi:hypothetical protein